MLKLGIAGNPVFHSKSKELFKLISKKNNIELKYLPISTFNSKSIIDFSKNFIEWNQYHYH
jgi:shikimate 5-dehydrogenase